MGARASCEPRNPHQLDIEAVEAATPKVDISEIDNAMQCSEQETQETQSNADKGMNDRSPCGSAI